MKKSLWIAVLMIIAIGGGIIFYIFNSMSAGIPAGTNYSDSIHSSSTPNKVYFALVTVLAQSVYLKESGMKDEVIIEKSASTTIGDVIRTSSVGRAIIEAPESHPTLLDYNSKLAISVSQENGKTILELFGGSLWSRTKKSAEKGEFNVIKTGNTVAVVRGTSFGVHYAVNMTTLIVTEGLVAFYNKDPKTNDPILGSKVLVGAGKKATIRGNNKPVLSDITPEDKKDPWFKFNNEDAPIKTNTTPSLSPIKTPIKTPIASSTATTPNQNTGGSSGDGSIPNQGTTRAPLTATVSSISPQEMQMGDNQTFVILRGDGFQNIQNLSVAKNIPPDFEILDDATLRFHIGKLTSGTYDIDLFLKDESVITFQKMLVIR